MKAFGDKANSDLMRDKWIREITNDVVIERVFPLMHDSLQSLLVRKAPGQVRMVPKTVQSININLHYSNSCKIE